MTIEAPKSDSKSEASAMTLADGERLFAPFSVLALEMSRLLNGPSGLPHQGHEALCAFAIKGGVSAPMVSRMFPNSENGNHFSMHTSLGIVSVSVVDTPEIKELVKIGRRVEKEERESSDFHKRWARDAGLKTHAWLSERGFIDPLAEWAIIPPPEQHITFLGHRWSRVLAPFVGQACAAFEAQGIQQVVREAADALKKLRAEPAASPDAGAPSSEQALTAPQKNDKKSEKPARKPPRSL